ncbi:hypothetical protein EV13_1355 [Prochlorococcus sp. MIT 0702]|nr:hypothetical protein EV12_0791 [Prochlorococcus sp. MIT 0701]KGG28976.1 hypothetical protein EV13_1355 [Prochlorococcus sp. MIT 0702]KGG35537.1 hypothetical protein EV14_0830 [Prochlorococcus sp. MIT 0703]
MRSGQGQSLRKGPMALAEGPIVLLGCQCNQRIRLRSGGQ